MKMSIERLLSRWRTTLLPRSFYCLRRFINQGYLENIQCICHWQTIREQHTIIIPESSRVRRNHVAWPVRMPRLAVTEPMLTNYRML